MHSAKVAGRNAWPVVSVATRDGVRDAIAPYVISASRSTDIPAFYSDWFLSRLRAGYLKWLNPFSRRVQYISFENVRAIVFWSKNPKPLVDRLGEIDRRGIAYYFQFTLNDYEAEGFEPNVPPLSERLDTLRLLSGLVGRERIVWRFDPLILTDRLGVQQLLAKIESVGDKAHGLARRMVFSFADIAGYAKVRRNLARADVAWREFSRSDMLGVSREIGALAKRWGIEVATCAEGLDLSEFGICRSKCVDDRILLSIARDDTVLAGLYGQIACGQLGLFGTAAGGRLSRKDRGQRDECDCVFSKDIGQYNTCPHLCVYCYANASRSVIERNMAKHTTESQSVVD